ncbi:hypothetical protein EUGRSUZ_I01540 [Eucalyptus grandis]|uniref:Uncharacterized protein n=2 Tax=Eucalyptus grandis TaxID=71139 RepID=A0ACC3JFD4_EUCGR|nr:hypothetical protein EUGRSUZ_I01540 [Eucalyptus grandis]
MNPSNGKGKNGCSAVEYNERCKDTMISIFTCSDCGATFPIICWELMTGNKYKSHPVHGNQSCKLKYY